MKISITTFILILTFCATGFSQSAFSLELKYQPTIRTYEWNKLEKHPSISELYYPNKKGLLVNYRIGKKGRHYIKTGLMIDNFKYRIDDLEYYPGTMRPLHAEEVIYKNYNYKIPLYYSFLYKGIYTEVGAQFNRVFMSKYYYDGELGIKRFIKKGLTYFEYRFGIGYQKMFGQIGGKIGASVDANFYSFSSAPFKGLYYDYGIDLGLLYQFK